MRILKNIFGKKTKLHVDNAADSIGRLLGFLIITNFSTSGTTGYIEWGNGFKVAWNRSVTIRFDISDRMAGSWDLPVTFDPRKSTAIGSHPNSHMDLKFRGNIGASVTTGNSAHVRMWSTTTNQPYVSGDSYICQVLVIGFS